MFEPADLQNAVPVSPGTTQQSAWSSARIHKRLDSEMAAQLRILLSGDFSCAQDWLALNRALRGKGFYLQRTQVQLMLHDIHSHVEICTSQLLGFPLKELETRLGMIQPRR